MPLEKLLVLLIPLKLSHKEFCSVLAIVIFQGTLCDNVIPAHKVMSPDYSSVLSSFVCLASTSHTINPPPIPHAYINDNILNLNSLCFTVPIHTLLTY